MGRWFYGLVVGAALAGGCAAPTRPAEMQEQLADGGDGAFDLGGGAGASDLAGLGGGNCVDGASCSTGEQGACGAGHIVCSGGVASCVPDATTQACYTGPANTMGVGACKAGVQTCVGGLGSCDGQVLPAAAENCFNDVDDDCDGVVNNGCPTAITTGTPHALTARGDAGSGNPFSLRCPAGSFVSKTVIYGDNSDTYLSGLDIYCGTPTLVRGASSYSVTVAVSATAISTAGGTRTSGATTTFTCGGGFTPGWQTPDYTDTSGLDALGLTCAQTAVALDASNKLTFMQTAATAASSTGFNPDGYNYGSLANDNCPNGEVLVGYDGRNGTWIYDFAAVCAPLAVTYK